MRISLETKFEKNIENIKEIILSDYLVSDDECNKLCKLVDKITPEMIENNSSIMLNAKTIHKLILIDNPKYISTCEIVLDNEIKNYKKYIISIFCSMMLCYGIYWYCS